MWDENKAKAKPEITFSFLALKGQSKKNGVPRWAFGAGASGFACWPRGATALCSFLGLSPSSLILRLNFSRRQGLYLYYFALTNCAISLGWRKTKPDPWRRKLRSQQFRTRLKKAAAARNWPHHELSFPLLSFLCLCCLKSQGQGDVI